MDDPNTIPDHYNSVEVIPESDRLHLGTKIRKVFPGHGTFDGWVERYTFGGRFYRVQYQDDDFEDMSHEHALQYCVLEETAVRRSGRERQSTLIHVDGHAIKRENNYVLKGLSYQYGVAQDEGKKVAPKQKKAPVNKKKQAPRKVSKAETARMEFKNKVEERIQEKAVYQHAFLYEKGPILQPFLDPKVYQSIRSSQPTPNAVAAALAPRKHCVPPEGITADLRDYQQEGLEWMVRMHERNLGMILGDEMGLGKTLQTISLICHLKEQDNGGGPSLIICPLSVLYSWCSEIEQWAPGLRYLRLHNSQTSSLDITDLNEYDMVITTYEMAKARDLSRLWSRQFFNLLVLDEGHKIKSQATQMHQAVCKIHAENRLILTGTPLANNLVELEALLHFLMPAVFTTAEPFADAFDLTQQRVDPVKLQQAHGLLQLFMLRRLKSQVEKLMPKRIETKVLCPLSNTQIWFYKALLIKDLNLFTGKQSASKSSMLNNLVMQLRKCCIHPFLFDGVDDPDFTSLESLVGSSGKLAVLDKLLRSLYQKQHRVVLFSQFTQVLDILEDYCCMRGWKYCRFDGSTSRAKRNYVVNSFNAPDSEKFIFLMSTRSGGMGLNLQTADTCVLFDSDWNPQPDLQAMARVHRIGQTKTVHVYRLVTDGTVEQRMVERAEKKLYLDRMVTHDGASEEMENEETDGSKLLQTLRFGCNAVFGQGEKKQALPSDDDIEVITDRNRSEDFSSGKLQGNADSTADNFDATKAFAPTTDFGGIDFLKIRAEYDKKKTPKDMCDVTKTWAKRQRKNRIKMLDGAGTGYGKSSVPVLAANDYELETGEKSVFDRELKGRGPVAKKKLKISFEHNDYCQSCNDGGSLIMCPRCPNSLHLYCAGVNRASEFLCCSQHHCSVCNKPGSHVGGLLFPCASVCPYTYCEDHLPAEARFLDEGSPHHESKGYHLKNGVYVFCNKDCEELAAKELNWVAPSAQNRASCPPALDVSSSFGGQVDENIEVEDEKSELIVTGKRRRNKVNYALGKNGTHSPDKKQCSKQVQASNRPAVLQIDTAVATTGASSLAPAVSMSSASSSERSESPEIDFLGTNAFTGLTGLN